MSIRSAKPLASSALSATAIVTCSAVSLTAIVVANRVLVRLAEKRCENGLIVSIPGLNRACSSYLVRCIPWALTELHLMRLDLKTSDINPGLSSLSGLQIVDLSFNLLDTFPTQLLSLRRCVDLNLAHNQLRSVPQSISKLKNLRRLNFMDNKLEGALTEGIGALNHLESLGLKDNKLTALNSNIGSCTALVELYITANELVTLPPSIGQCKLLRKLQASFNSFTHLPPEIEGCESLELCRLAANPSLSEVPPELTNLPSLSWLSLAGCLWSPGLGIWDAGIGGDLKKTDLRFGRKLGEGASGSVFASVHEGEDVAIKVFKGVLSPDGRAADELEISCTVDHPNIIRVLGIVGGSRPCAIMKLVPTDRKPLADRPDRHSVLRCKWAPGQIFSPEAVMRIGAHIARALEYLHSKGIAHGDVYAHNVLADVDGHATLCDFGASFMFTNDACYHFEALEVRAFGILMRDLAQRGGPDVAWIAADMASLCMSPVLGDRPTFRELGNQLEAELMQGSTSASSVVSTVHRPKDDVLRHNDGGVQSNRCELLNETHINRLWLERHKHKG